jgi:hypothetical protein
MRSSTKPYPCRAFLVLVIGAITGCSSAVTEDQACKALLRAVEKAHLVTEPVPPGHPYCEPTKPRLPGYYQFGLHYAPDEWPKDWVGSDLLGWFAVRQSDGHVFAWDVAEDELGDPVPE